jgi:S-adenosylmethionine-diacylglycerol 3-amino-3-carboxypropyl transferase
MNTIVQTSEAEAKADFSHVRYAQCWEDAGILTEALQIEPHHACLAIASAGDNALALLAGSPRSVIAIDLSSAQLACLELRVAAYRALDDDDLLRFTGARPAWNRATLYRLCRPHLSHAARAFWDARPVDIANGFYSAGRFERYLHLFRTQMLPLVHGEATIASLLARKDRDERAWFYETIWDTWRWRATFGLFFSKVVMSALGRDPRFFDYAHGDLPAHLRERIRHAFVELDPSANPYLHWILRERFGDSLPFALRPANVAAIRRNLDRLSWEACSLESFLARGGPPIDRFALSDVFEYTSAERYEALLQALARRSAPAARLAYWNMLVRRTRPDALAASIVPDIARSRNLHERDNTFFYSRFVIEDVR